MPTVGEVLEILAQKAPVPLAEDYDNSGLLIGNALQEVKGILCTLEVTAEVLQEALDKKCNLIVSHHPLIFRGIRRLDPETSQGRLIARFLLHNTALISMHTNWDRIHGGTSFYMARLLGLEDVQVLAPEKDRLSLLAFTVPAVKADNLRTSLISILKPVSVLYDNACQWWPVAESYKPQAHARPAEGNAQSISESGLTRLQFIVYNEDILPALQTLRKEHPFEEFWHEIQPLGNTAQNRGFGCMGVWKEELTWQQCLQKVKATFGCRVIRHSHPHGGPVRRVAFCGGSGASLYKEACRAGADVFFTADVKYHDLAEASTDTILADLGHYESEYRVAEQFSDVLKEALPESIPVHVFNPQNPVFYF